MNQKIKNQKILASQAKQARRVVSCPGELERPSSPTFHNAIQGTDYFFSQSCSSLTSNVRSRQMAQLRSTSEHNLATLAIQLTVASSSCGSPILLALSRSFFPSFLLSHLAARHENRLLDRTISFNDPPFIRLVLDSLTQPPDSGRSIQPVPPQSSRYKLESEPQIRFFQQFVTTIQRKLSTQSSISRFARMFTPSHASVISIPAGQSVSSIVPPETVEGQPVLRRKRLARLAKRRDPLTTMGWLNVSPRALAVESESMDESRLGIQTPESEREPLILSGSGILTSRAVPPTSSRPSSSGNNTQR